MREIKFRAWDENGMVYDVGLDPNTIPYTIPKGVRGFANFVYHPEAVLMQHTGLKDKNGKEIYEGDIVNFLENYGFAGWHESDNPGVVEFNKGQYLVKGSQMSLAGDISHHGLEVIGNIYENPELLK